MNCTLRSFSKNLTLISLSAVLSSAIVLHQQDERSTDPPPMVLKARGLEIVDANGRICATLRAADNGGSLQLYSPNKSEGQEGMIAYLGSVFGSESQFLLREPKPGKASFAVHIGGEPSCAIVSALGANGTPSFRLGGIGNENPMLSLWHLNEEEPYLSK